jgi:hypothetical protein
MLQNSNTTLKLGHVTHIGQVLSCFEQHKGMGTRSVAHTIVRGTVHCSEKNIHILNSQMTH